MGKKLYIRNFPLDADEKILFRQFGKKKVEKIDIIEKKDENGEIISRFCYLYTFLDEQADAIVKKWNQREWNGLRLDVKIAKESFLERAAKLRSNKIEEEKKEFKPLFKSSNFKKDESSSSEESESDSDGTDLKQSEKRNSNLQTAAARLQNEVKSKKESDIRRQAAIEEKQQRYLQQKNTQFKGKKVTFSDSDDSEPENGNKKELELGDGSDEDEIDWESKIDRPEFEGEKGGALFEMEKEISAKDSRFKLGEEFKEDIQVKPDMSIQAKLKRKREFKGDVRFVPGQEDEIDEEERLALEIKELKKEKEKFTNVTAPKVSDETHFHVEELDIGQEVSDAKTSPGFSFGFNFVPEEKSDSEDEDVEEKQQIEKNKQIEKQKAKIISKAETPKVITTGEKFNLFKKYDISRFFMPMEKIDAERERLRVEGVREYSQMSRNAKRRRGDREELRGQSKLQRVLNWW